MWGSRTAFDTIERVMPSGVEWFGRPAARVGWSGRPLLQVPSVEPSPLQPDRQILRQWFSAEVGDCAIASVHVVYVVAGIL